jgi:uncharacterized HAD superfamily protein
MNFRSISDLNQDVVANLHRLPSDIDVVVGIARSGMLPASLISLALNLPLSEMHHFSSGRLLGTGSTRKTTRSGIAFADVRHALIVDDSIHTGDSLREARALLAPLAEQMQLTFCAIYAADAIPLGDEINLVHLPQPRVFEWNLMHHPVLNAACVDIDGVLCLDPTAQQNDDGPAYIEFLREATARPIPTSRIKELVTSRLEKYRPETEAWLRRHKIDYEKLVMLDLPSAEERRRLGAHASFKGEHYRKSSATIFIESELPQAQEIARISGKPVLSIEGPVMCYPGVSPASILYKIRGNVGPRQRALRLARRVIGAKRYELAKALLKSKGVKA